MCVVASVRAGVFGSLAQAHLQGKVGGVCKRLIDGQRIPVHLSLVYKSYNARTSRAETLAPNVFLFIVDESVTQV